MNRELIESAERLHILHEQRVQRLEAALAESWQVARLLARDVSELAALLPPGDALEAEAVAGAVRRARMVLGRFGAGGGH
jgi:hypothetical protein